MSNKPVVLTSAEETGKISRNLLSWLNEYPDLPVEKINFEFLGELGGMSLSTIQGAYKTAQYIGGGYAAAYQFKLIYRVVGANNNARLDADETLDKIADWAASRTTKPDIGLGKVVTKITTNSNSSLFAKYEDGFEDHQVLMTLFYEVI